MTKENVFKHGVNSLAIQKAVDNFIESVITEPPSIKSLIKLLSIKRPHGGIAEYSIANAIADSYDGGYQLFDEQNGLLATIVEVCDRHEMVPPVLFSAHLDTVHRDEGLQTVIINADMLSKNDGAPLGADDGAGVWLLLGMIEAGVPGVYSFTVGEECGGIGARGIAKHHEDFLKRFKYAVAFDRRSTHSVITRQGMGRCCSDTFANALADAINMVMVENGADDYSFMSPDPTGVYTDTAEYTDVIPECTNISIGYQSEHSGNETQNAAYAMALLNACIEINWSSLPVERDPKAIEYEFEDDMWYYKRRASTESYDTTYYDRYDLTSYEDLMFMTEEQLTEWVRTSSPTLVAGILFDVFQDIT